MKLYTPEGVEAEAAPNQIEILLNAGWTREKAQNAVKDNKDAKDTEVEVEEKKLKRLLKPKE